MGARQSWTWVVRRTGHPQGPARGWKGRCPKRPQHRATSSGTAIEFGRHRAASAGHFHGPSAWQAVRQARCNIRLKVWIRESFKKDCRRTRIFFRPRGAPIRRNRANRGSVFKIEIWEGKTESGRKVWVVLFRWYLFLFLTRGRVALFDHMVKRLCRHVQGITTPIQPRLCQKAHARRRVLNGHRQAQGIPWDAHVRGWQV